MDHTLEIYLYENQLVFTGISDLYFEKYRGIGPGIYSRPILCLPRGSSVDALQNAILSCVRVLEQNQSRILEENTQHTITQMETILFRNFKIFGIKTTRSLLKRTSTVIMVRMNASPSVCKCIPGNRGMVIQKEVPLSPDASVTEFARCVCDFLS